MTWRWEYDPDEEYLDGSTYQEAGPKGNVAHVPGGFFLYLIVPRHECLYVHQATCL